MQPNVVIIMADDLGYGDIACFGNDALRTPNLDRLAAEGVTLTEHYSASPLCAPARAALLTGRYNHRVGAVDVPSNRGLDRIALDEKTMADVFRAAGYATGMVGKWHNGLHDPRHHPRARGFDSFVGFLNGGMDYYQWALDVNGETKYADGRYLTDVFTDASIDFIQDHAEEPFFLYLAYNAPHTPFQAPEPMIQYYRDMQRFNEPVSTLYAMIEQMDAGIGRIVSKLEELGLRENTIILFTSDNGPAFIDGAERYNGPFAGSKGSVLEGGIRVPALLSAANLPSGTQVDAPVHFCDWLPTLCGLSGVTPRGTKPLDGQDRSATLAGEAEPWSIYFWQRNRYEPVERCNGAVRDGDWKLVLPMREGGDWKDAGDNAFYFHGLRVPHWLMDIDPTLPDRPIGPEHAPRLFNIKADPGEAHDLAAAHPDRVAAMSARWDQWFAEVRDEWQRAYAANTTRPEETK